MSCGIAEITSRVGAELSEKLATSFPSLDLTSVSCRGSPNVYHEVLFSFSRYGPYLLAPLVVGASMLKPPDACTHIFGKSENLFRLDNDTEDSLPQV